MNSTEGEVKAFRSIEILPAWNYYKAKESGDLRYLLVLDDYFDLTGIDAPGWLEEIWVDIYDQHITHFGVDKETIELTKLEHTNAILRAKLLLTNERILNTHIKTNQRRIDSILENNANQKSVKFDELVMQLERWLKMPIDSMRITYLKFFTYLNQYNKEAKQRQIQQLTHGNKK